jgi:hypothetical protein
MMKKIILGILLMTVCMAASTKVISPDNELIEYTGRIDFSQGTAPRFSYSGVSVRACFTGTSIGIILEDNIGENYYNLFIDGELQEILHVKKGKRHYSIAGGLEDKIHEIEIFKRTEEMFGKTRFLGFLIDENASLVHISSKRAKLIEYIGDSITCGYGNEGQNGETFGPVTENHYQTYAAITSRKFNARHLTVCKSGIGVYRNYDGPPKGNEDCMPNYYSRIFLWDEEPKYDFSEQPDLICINLGTNDFSTGGGDSAKYSENYLRLIDTLQTRYENPTILCLLGPMLSGKTLVKVRQYLYRIVKIAQEKNRGDVHFFEMSAQTGKLGIGIDFHPSVAQHRKNAEELTAFVEKIMGWKKISP